MGDRAIHLEKEEGCILILAYEQAIGYMPANMSPDKDGVRSAAVFAEMTNYLYTVGNTTLTAHLQTIYNKYGYMAGRDSYFFCRDPKVMFGIFATIRNGGHYPTTMGPYRITRIRDLMKPGYDNGAPNNVPTLPIGSSPMITFFFDNGAIITLRGSGTEPKLKYYAELPGAQGDADTVLADMIKEMVEHFLRPVENKLEPPN
jgi:phosphoglucomutase